MAAAAVVAPLAATVRAQQPPQPATTPRSVAPDRFHRQLGRGHHRRLALPHGDAAEGRLRQRPAERRGTESWPTRGTRQKDIAAGEQCRAFGAAGADADADPAARLVAGRHHAEVRDRQRPAGAPLPVRRAASRRRRARSGRVTRSRRGRRLHEGQGMAPAGAGRWRRRRRSEPGGPQLSGSLKVVTTRMRPGYLRRNGVPYSGAGGADRVLRSHQRTQRRLVADCDLDARRPGVPGAAVHDVHAFQARAGRLEVESAGVRDHSAFRTIDTEAR